MPPFDPEDAIRLQAIVRERAADPLLYVTAFDGVIAPYAANPDDVTVTVTRRRQLTSLMATPNATVAVISGRSLDDLTSRIDLGPGAFYIGLHGLELAGPGLAWRWEGVDRFAELFDDVASVVAPQVEATDGAWLEHKGAALALHTRDAASDDTVWLRFHLLNAAAPLVNSHAVRVFRGRHVMELLPNRATDSRCDAIAAVRGIIARQSARPVFTVYVGPELADDDAVKAAAASDVVLVAADPSAGDAFADAVIEARSASLGNAPENPAG